MCRSPSPISNTTPAPPSPHAAHLPAARSEAQVVVVARFTAPSTFVPKNSPARKLRLRLAASEVASGAEPIKLQKKDASRRSMAIAGEALAAPPPFPGSIPSLPFEATPSKHHRLSWLSKSTKKTLARSIAELASATGSNAAGSPGATPSAYGSPPCRSNTVGRWEQRRPPLAAIRPSDESNAAGLWEQRRPLLGPILSAYRSNGGRRQSNAIGLW